MSCCSRTWAAPPRASTKSSTRSSRWPSTWAACWASEVPLAQDWLDGVEVAEGQVVLCENVRFNKGEKKDDEALVQEAWRRCATST